MRNSKFIRKFKSFLLFFIPRSALGIPHFSTGQQKILIALALFILALLYLKFYLSPFFRHDGAFQEVVIEVVGEVQEPGVYVFKTYPTLIEAVKKAGGFKEAVRFEANQSSEVLETGTLLTVSKRSAQEIKITISTMDARKLLAFSIPLDLNRVSAEDL